MAQVHQHGRHHRRLHHPEQEADGDQHVDVADHAGERGKATPEDQADKDQLLHTALFGVDGARYLEEEVTKEEQCPQQRRQCGGDVQVFSHAGSGGEPVVGAVQVRQAIGEEHDRDDVPPAARCQALALHGSFLLSLLFLLQQVFRGQVFTRFCAGRGLAAHGAAAALPCRHATARRGCRTSCHATLPRLPGGPPAAH
ncbi:hypothetical protein D3C85_1351820 [compost metagenome]